MKHFFSGMLVALALMLAIVLGLAALAETLEPETPELPALEDAQTPEDSAAQDQPAQQDPAADASASAALQDALKPIAPRGSPAGRRTWRLS